MITTTQAVTSDETDMTPPAALRFADIPRPAIGRTLDPELKLLFRHAPQCLRYLIEHSIIFAERSTLGAFRVGDIRVLTGGVNAVAYLVQRGDWSVVVKLDYRSMRAEAEALGEWHKRGANVVQVLSAGQIPLDIGSRHSVRYVILQGITGPEGDPAPVAINYAAEHPRRARAIGRAAGHELAIMHSVTTKRTFGEYGDMKGDNTKPYGTFNTYLGNYLHNFKQFLAELGYGETRYRRLKRHVREIRFPKTGRYIHGDPSLRNILLHTLNPLVIVFIDPNPIIGHPTWDLAIIANNAEIAARKSKLRPKNDAYRAEAYLRTEYHAGVMLGYAAESKRRIHAKHLDLVRLVHLMMLTSIAINSARNDGRDLAEDATVRAHRELLADLMAAVLPPADTHNAK